jgi:hypothetical protein
MIGVPTPAPSLKIDVDCDEHRRLPTQEKKKREMLVGRVFFYLRTNREGQVDCLAFSIFTRRRKELRQIQVNGSVNGILSFGCTRNNRVCRLYPI